MLAGALLATCPASADAGPGGLGAYVRARAADADQAYQVAAAGYEAALAGDPDNAVVAIRAYRAALEAGDYPLIARARTVLETAGVAPADASLLALAQAIHGNDHAGVERALADLERSPLDFLAPSLRAWQHFETEPAKVSAVLDRSSANPVARRYASENRALLLIASGRARDGVDMLRALQGSDASDPGLRSSAAELLAARGELALARTLLPDAKTLTPVAPSLAFGLSRLMVRLAADLGDEGTARVSVALMRAALQVDPDNDDAKLILAGALASQGANSRAIAALDTIAPESRLHDQAVALRIAFLNDAGQESDALDAAARQARRAGSSVDDLRRYADQLVAADRFDEAAAAYAVARKRATRPDWTLLLQQGSALDRAGNWASAEPILRRVVELAPDQPIALNYLGYAQIEHRGDVAAARRLIERANAIKPDDLSIVDSLAWAWYKQGDVARALPLIERAAQGEPPNSTIIEHLGDIYWDLGRRFEARYAWQAASIHADDDDARRLADKLADGIGERN